MTTQARGQRSRALVRATSGVALTATALGTLLCASGPAFADEPTPPTRVLECYRYDGRGIWTVPCEETWRTDSTVPAPDHVRLPAGEVPVPYCADVWREGEVWGGVWGDCSTAPPPRWDEVPQPLPPPPPPAPVVHPATSLTFTALAPQVSYGAAVRPRVRLASAADGRPLAGRAVELCRRVAGRAQVCTPATTDGSGTATATFAPPAGATVWASYAGETATDVRPARSASRTTYRTVQVAPSVRVGRPAPRTVAASVTPGGQAQLQTLRSGRWSVARVARTAGTVRWPRLARGTYRVVVPAQAGRVATTSTALRVR